MNRLLSVLAFVSLSVLSMADQVSVTNGGTSLIIVPAVIPASFVSSITNWVPSATYTNGNVVKASNYVYTCRYTGVSSNVLAVFNGDTVVRDGAVTWVKNDIWDRKVVGLQNTSTNGVLLLTIANGNYTLNPLSSLILDASSSYQGAISATATVANVTCNSFWY